MQAINHAGSTLVGAVFAAAKLLLPGNAYRAVPVGNTDSELIGLPELPPRQPGGRKRKVCA